MATILGFYLEAVMYSKVNIKYVCRRRNESGIALVWAAGSAMAIMLLIALAISILNLVNSAQQVSQWADYCSEASLERYLSLNDRYQGAATISEADRRSTASGYGIQVANEKTNDPFQTTVVNPLIRKPKIEYGWWEMPDNGGSGSFTADVVPDDGVGCDRRCNAVVVTTTEQVYTGVFAKLFSLEKAGPATSYVMVVSQAVFDERLLQKDMYPQLLLRRIEPFAVAAGEDYSEQPPAANGKPPKPPEYGKPSGDGKPKPCNKPCGCGKDQSE